VAIAPIQAADGELSDERGTPCGCSNAPRRSRPGPATRSVTCRSVVAEARAQSRDAREAVFLTVRLYRSGPCCESHRGRRPAFPCRTGEDERAFERSEQDRRLLVRYRRRNRDRRAVAATGHDHADRVSEGPATRTRSSADLYAGVE
jgi:hypothetical protein